MNHLDLSPPYSVEAEQGVLGGLLLDNNTWDLVADKLDTSDFFSTRPSVAVPDNGKPC